MSDLGMRYLRIMAAEKKNFAERPLPRYDSMSIGDELVLSGKIAEYKTAAFFVCCDDEIRESGSEQKAKKIYDLCAENGWIPISMKNDWTTVFGEGVVKKAGY